MPSHPSSLPGPLAVLAALLLVLYLLLPLQLVGPLATLTLSGFLLAGGDRCKLVASPVKSLTT